MRDRASDPGSAFALDSRSHCYFLNKKNNNKYKIIKL